LTKKSFAFFSKLLSSLIIEITFVVTSTITHHASGTIKNSDFCYKFNKSTRSTIKLQTINPFFVLANVLISWEFKQVFHWRTCWSNRSRMQPRACVYAHTHGILGAVRAMTSCGGVDYFTLQSLAPWKEKPDESARAALRTSHGRTSNMCVLLTNAHVYAASRCIADSRTFSIFFRRDGNN